MSSNPCNTRITWLETIKRRTRAVYGCLVVGQSLCGRRLSLQPVGCTPTLSVTQQLPLVALYKCCDFYFFNSLPPAAPASSMATRRIQGCHPHPPGTVWWCSLLPTWRLVSCYRCSHKQTALGWHSSAARQSDAHLFLRQNLQCSWISSLELSVVGPQTAVVVTQPF